MFKELVNELIQQGWRIYFLGDLPNTILHRLDMLAKRHLLEFRIYEGKNLLFVKTSLPKREKKKEEKK
jgi:hypothetical protein